MRVAIRRTAVIIIAIGAIGIQKIWTAIRIFLDFVGLAGLPDDLAKIWMVLPVIDSETGRWILGGIGLAGFIAAESAPYFRTKIENWRKSDLSFIWSYEFPSGQVEFWNDVEGNLRIKYVCRVGVTNNTRKTIKGVKVRLEAVYPEKNLDISSDPDLPKALRPWNTQAETVDLNSGETEYWDLAKFWEKEEKSEFSDIFICCFKKTARHSINRGMYKAILAIYSRDTPRLNKEFCLGVTTLNQLIFMPWEEWLKKRETLEMAGNGTR